MDGSPVWNRHVSIPFLHRGVFRGPVEFFEIKPSVSVSIPFLHRGVFRVISYPQRTVLMRLVLVSIPFLHRGVFRGGVGSTGKQTTPCFNPLSSSGRLQGSPCQQRLQHCYRLFQSPFFLGASSGSCHRGKHGCRVHGFQSPFFIGASSGSSANRISVSNPIVSIPFLHRGVFRAYSSPCFSLAACSGFNPLSSSGRLQGGNGTVWTDVVVSFNPLSSSGRLQGTRPRTPGRSKGWVSIPFLHRGVFRGAKSWGVNNGTC